MQNPHVSAQPFSQNPRPSPSQDNVPKMRPNCGPNLGRSSLDPRDSAGPKHGSINVGAAKRHESSTFLQRSFFNVALQFFACCSAAFGKNDFCTAEKRMLQCNFCSATFRKLQRNFRFRLWHVAGVGFRGVGFLGFPETPGEVYPLKSPQNQ